MALVFTGKNLKLYSSEADGQFQIRYWDSDGKRKRNRVPKDADPIAFAKKMDDILGQSKTLTVAERAMDEMMERYKDLMRSHVENGIGVKEAFDDYAAWAKENGYLRTMNQTSFSSRLEAAGWEKVRKAHGMVWRGLRVKK